jgi:hypothetical protein
MLIPTIILITLALALPVIIRSNWFARWVVVGGGE